MRWIIPEPLVPRQEDRRLGERDWRGGVQVPAVATERPPIPNL